MKNECNCNQGRTPPCYCATQHEKSDQYFKWFLLFAALYFLIHIAVAVAAEPVIINQPSGGQTVCIVQGSYIVCY